MHPSTLSRRRFLSVTSAAAAAGLFGRFAASACPIPIDPDSMTDSRNLAKAINQFALDLHRELDRDEKGSVFFSPFSIETALAMTSAGARGETLAEMQKTLHLPMNPHGSFRELIDYLNQSGRDRLRGFELTVANAIWAMKGFPWRKEFAELANTNYGTGLVETDFRNSEESRSRINTWVEKETKNRIKDLIPPDVLDSKSRMVLTNAIYFKGMWQTTFDKKNTKDAPFTRADNSTTTVPMMALTSKRNYSQTRLGGRSGLDVQILELPYSGKELSMLVYLPETGHKVDQLLQRIDEAALTAPELKTVEVKVFLPRFKVETEYSLKPVLMNLGMKKAFADADFSGLHTSKEELLITHVLHKAFVEVNEEGTEAAAATAVVLGRASAPRDEKPIFRADRPFVFAIRDNKTGTALFVGKYAGPK